MVVLLFGCHGQRSTVHGSRLTVDDPRARGQGCVLGRVPRGDQEQRCVAQCGKQVKGLGHANTRGEGGTHPVRRLGSGRTDGKIRPLETRQQGKHTHT